MRAAALRTPPWSSPERITADKKSHCRPIGGVEEHPAPSSAKLPWRLMLAATLRHTCTIPTFATTGFLEVAARSCCAKFAHAQEMGGLGPRGCAYMYISGHAVNQIKQGSVCTNYSLANCQAQLEKHTFCGDFVTAKRTRLILVAWLHVWCRVPSQCARGVPQQIGVWRQQALVPLCGAVCPRTAVPLQLLWRGRPVC